MKIITSLFRIDSNNRLYDVIKKESIYVKTSYNKKFLAWMTIHIEDSGFKYVYKMVKSYPLIHITTRGELYDLEIENNNESIKKNRISKEVLNQELEEYVNGYFFIDYKIDLNRNFNKTIL